MKKIRFKLAMLLIMLIAFSCDEPVTVVTNIVHADGSVTRKIEMRNTKDKFEKSVIQVPYDSTWTINKSSEVGVKGDTTWIIKAEKLFNSVGEINKLYRNDSGVNGKYSRHAQFSKKFRWFNTVYRFSEIIDKRILSGYPLCNFMNKEERNYFYAPDDLKSIKMAGADSLKYKKLSDSIKVKSDKWLVKNATAMWIEEFSKLAGANAGPGLSEKILKTREDEFVAIIEATYGKFDSLWARGVVLRKFIGEADAAKYKTEADSAMSIVTDKFFTDFGDYAVRTIMPGKLTDTNGYIDSTMNLLWSLKSDYFYTDQYEMWAESKTPNIWSWVISGSFLLFVITGIILKRKKG